MKGIVDYINGLSKNDFIEVAQVAHTEQFSSLISDRNTPHRLEFEFVKTSLASRGVPLKFLEDENEIIEACASIMSRAVTIA